MSATFNLTSVKLSLDKLQTIERELIASLIERDEVVRASLVALLSEQHLVILGPPSTAKSALITDLVVALLPIAGDLLFPKRFGSVQTGVGGLWSIILIWI